MTMLKSELVFLKVVLFVDFPLFCAFGMVIDFGLLDALGHEGCDHAESVV